MNKKTINFALTLFLAYIFALFLPWWSVMVAALITSFLIPLRKAAVFIIPFLAVALLWIIQSWLLSSANDFILAKKIATLLPLGGNPTLLILVTGIIGGLAAGIAGIFGKQCKLVFK
ncbi:MAG: hypothetical protein L3J25_00375 [Flavobacteriaceae bacterium]|nr:hypothetical protein [Flavobacteriaceae bacterium]